jgi:SAM-dependent methyltransferase
MAKKDLILNENIDFTKAPSDIVKWGILNLMFIDKRYENKPINILLPGCGTGRNAHYLSSLGYNIVGFDISEKNIEKVELRYNKLPISSNFNFFVHDLRDGLPFSEGAFDLVIDIFVYNEQKNEDDRRLYIQEISRILNEDGHLLLGVHSLQDEYFSNFSHLDDKYPRYIYDHYSKKTVLCYRDEDLFKEIKDSFEISMKWKQNKKQSIEGNNYLRKYLVTLLKKS